MELRLINCSRCHKLTVSGALRHTCKECFLKELDRRASAAETPSPSRTEPAAYRCRNCGVPMDQDAKFCLRCRLRLIHVTGTAVGELSDKLARFPALRGTDQTFVEGSRFHSRRALRAAPRSGSRPFTPATKYAS